MATHKNPLAPPATPISPSLPNPPSPLQITQLTLLNHISHYNELDSDAKDLILRSKCIRQWLWPPPPAPKPFGNKPYSPEKEKWKTELREWRDRIVEIKGEQDILGRQIVRCIGKLVVGKQLPLKVEDLVVGFLEDETIWRRGSWSGVVTPTLP